MKLSELKFKVITGTEERNRAIQEALATKGKVIMATLKITKWVLDATHLAYNAKVFGHFYPGLSYDTTNSLDHFVKEVDAPEVTFQQALDLISQVGEPEPEFPFKPFDRVIRGCVNFNGWLPDFFSHTANGFFYTIGSDKCIKKVAKFEGNESVAASLDTPEQWWEICNGIPKLMRR